MKLSTSLSQVEEPCGELVFDSHSYSVHLEAEFTDEPYRSHTQAREFVPLTITSGIRTKVAARFFIPLSEEDRTKKMWHRRIGEGQAWFYQEDRLLLLWRCNLHEGYRASNPLEDQNLHVLWQAFEPFLLSHFPQAVQIITPSWNRPYNESLWLQFIQQQGFTHPSPNGIPNAAFIKDVKAVAQGL